MVQFSTYGPKTYGPGITSGPPVVRGHFGDPFWRSKEQIGKIYLFADLSLVGLGREVS